MDVQTRSQIVDKHRYCVNCLAKSHDLRACPSRDTCRLCGKYHHTLLHASVKSRLNQRKSGSMSAPRSPARSTSTVASSSRKRRDITISLEPTNRRHSPTSSTQNQPQSVSTTVPDSHIISEAIRSLAQVLCVQHK